MKRWAHLTTLALIAAACSAPEPVATTSTTTTTPEPTTTTTTVVVPFAVTSPDFVEGGDVPVEFTCEGANVNPRLDISGIPVGSSHLVIVVDDPDAPLGTWTHWLEYDIETSGSEHTIPENSGVIGVTGVNSFNLTGYGGPCPPPGETHRYFFKVYALDGPLDLPAGADVEILSQAMTGRIVEEVALMALFGR